MVTPKPPLSYTRQFDGYAISYAPLRFEKRRHELDGASTRPTEPLLLVIGGERHGIPRAVLDACDGAIRIPMRGFIPSYNLQAAMAIVVGEHLRQLARS